MRRGIRTDATGAAGDAQRRPLAAGRAIRGEADDLLETGPMRHDVPCFSESCRSRAS